MYNGLNKIVQKRRAKVVRNVSFQGKGSPAKKVAKAGFSLIELAFLVPTSVGLKVANKSKNNAKKVAKEGTKIATTGKSSSKPLNFLTRISTKIGTMYVKQATGYNDFKRGQRASKMGIKASKGAYNVTKPLLNKSLNVFIALGTSFTSAIMEHKMSKLHEKKAKAKAKEKLNRNDYQQLKNQYPDSSYEELQRIQKENAIDEQNKISKDIQNLEKEYNEKFNNEDNLHREVIQEKAKINKIEKSQYSNLVSEDKEKSLEDIMNVERSKMFNKNLYLESKRLTKFDESFSKCDKILEENNVRNIVNDLKKLEKLIH